jgi:hypothetical protein
MPLARIITHAVEQSQELAAELRGRGYDVEIVSPFDTPTTRADVELHLEECTPEEALIRAGVLPETNDMSVFIAPGAIANRRRQPEPSTTPTQMPKKWYESSDGDGIELPFMVKPLESVGEAAVESAQANELEGDAAAYAVDGPQFTSDEVDNSIASNARPIGAKSAFHKTLSESAMNDLASARTPAAAPSRARTLRIPVLAGTTQFFGWKAAAGVAVLAVVVLVLVMGAMRRKPAVPPPIAAPTNEVQQNVPAAPAQTAPAVPTRSSSSPAQGSTHGSTANSVSGARRVTKATSESTPGNPSNSKVRAASEPKPLPKKQPNDGIKRYSDLD